MTLKPRGGKHNEGRESPTKDRSASSSHTDVFVSLTSPMMLSVGASESSEHNRPIKPKRDRGFLKVSQPPGVRVLGTLQRALNHKSLEALPAH